VIPPSLRDRTVVSGAILNLQFLSTQLGSDDRLLKRCLTQMTEFFEVIIRSGSESHQIINVYCSVHLTSVLGGSSAPSNRKYPKTQAYKGSRGRKDSN